MRPADETPDCVVFLPYDLYPHVVSREAVRVSEDEVWIPSMHCSYGVARAIAVLGLSEGRKVQQGLDELQRMHSDQVKALWSTFMRAAATALPELPVWRAANGRKPF